MGFTSGIVMVGTIGVESYVNMAARISPGRTIEERPSGKRRGKRLTE